MNENKFNLQVSKESDIPIYRQVSHEITKMIQKGILSYGDKLPPERDLAKKLGTARGTVTKAYDHLAKNNVIEIIQGRGCFVSKGQDVMLEGEKTKAIELITKNIVLLEEQAFSHKEIKTLFNLVMMERSNELSKIKIALVDCNPEALTIFFKQLNYITKGIIDLFLLEDILKYPRKANRLSQYDLIVTTVTHYQDLTNFLPALSNKIMQVAISPSQQTIIDITSLKTSSKIGIICRSKHFQKIVLGRLGSFQIKIKNIVAIYENQEDRIEEFLSNLNAVIMPPNYEEHLSESVKEHLRNFVSRGGRIVNLNYQIDRGSLIYLEEQLSRIISV